MKYESYTQEILSYIKYSKKENTAFRETEIDLLNVLWLNLRMQDRFFYEIVNLELITNRNSTVYNFIFTVTLKCSVW